jgi:hypothetical protein
MRLHDEIPQAGHSVRPDLYSLPLARRAAKPSRFAPEEKSLERFQQKWTPLLRFESATKKR